MAYSTQRGYAESHPFAGEIRMGEVDVVVCPEELGFAIEIGSITLTECQMINQFHGGNGVPPQFTRGYGLSMGEGERKANVVEEETLGRGPKGGGKEELGGEE